MRIFFPEGIFDKLGLQARKPDQTRGAGMQINPRWRLAVALVAVVVLLAAPGQAAKIQQFKDDHGTLHISNSDEAGPGKPAAGPQAPINRKRYAPIFSTLSETLRAQRLQEQATEPPPPTAPPPVIAAPAAEPGDQMPPVSQAAPDAAPPNLGSGRLGGSFRGGR